MSSSKDFLAGLVRATPAPGDNLTPAQLATLAAEVDAVLSELPADERAEFLRGVLQRVATGNAAHDAELLAAGLGLGVGDLALRTVIEQRRSTAGGDRGIDPEGGGAAC